MKPVLRFVIILILVVLLLALGAVGGVALDRSFLLANAPPANIPPGATSAFELIAEAWNVIEQAYVDRSAVDNTNLAYGAINGMVNALGDTGHSRFMTPEMVQMQHNFAQGQFEGIGAYVEMRDGAVVIVAPIDQSPAQEAGLQPGDIILMVDGEDVTGMQLDEVVQRVLGPAGTTVTLTILDPATGQTRELTLERARIDLQNVTWQQLPGTTLAHVRISAFSEDVSQELGTALTEIKGGGLTGVILDLRSNPGGLLSEAVGVASHFLAPGQNVLKRQNAQGEISTVSAKSGGVAPDLPLVVLINQGSASASEIVAGAVQDNGRGTLVGETTFGTGTVLNEFSLSDGSALLLATEQWLTPDGRVIWHQGIEPDVLVPLAPEIQPLLPEAERTMTAEALRASPDEQLLRAVGLLEAP